MQRLWTLLLSGLLCALLAGPAQSQEGDSLYEPFPEPNPIGRAQRFVDQLRVGDQKSGALELSPAKLERGVVVDPRSGAVEPARAPRGGPTERGGGAGLAPSFGWLLGLAILAIVCVGTIGMSRAASRAT